MKKEIVVFAHIPKTAGSTMRGILKHQYPSGQVFIENNLMLPQNFERLQRHLEEQQPPLAGIGAHVGYGFHEYLPDIYHFRYFTFLRHPVDRVISNYYQWQRTNKISADMPLTTFVTTYPMPGQNLQTAFLSGYLNKHFRAGKEVQDLMGSHVPAEANTPELLVKAKDNLAKHVIVGLTERFDESLLLLAKAFGWHWYNLPYMRYNKGHNRLPKSQISTATLRTIEAHNQLDFELYAYAESLFAKQLETHEKWVDRTLPVYRSVNALFSKVMPTLLPIVRPLYNRLKSVS